MKKILLLCLAILMIALNGTAAFAVTEATAIKVDSNSRIFVMDSERELLVAASEGQILEPGRNIYVEILPEDGESISTKVASQYKVAMDYVDGSALVEKAEIENKKYTVLTDEFKLISGEAQYGLKQVYSSKLELIEAVNALEIDENTKTEIIKTYTQKEETGYNYFVSIQTKSDYYTDLQNLYASVKVIKRTSSASAAAASRMLNISVGYQKMTAGSTFEVENEYPVIDFEFVDNETEMLFGMSISYTVNVREQSNLYMGYSMRPDVKVVEENPMADIQFIDFLAMPTFNRMGDLRFFTSAESYIYEYKNGNLTLLQTTYDSDYDAYLLKTRNLTTYIISDRPLNNAVAGVSTVADPLVPTAPVTVVPVEEINLPKLPTKANPSTGGPQN